MANRGINKVILIGNIGQEPEVRHMPNGNMVTNITMATSESWKDKNTGENKEKTEWHRVVLFGRLAEIAAEYLHKGSQVYIEGSLQTRKWQDQNGNDRYTTEIVVNINGTMQMLGNRQNNLNPQLSNANFNKNDTISKKYITDKKNITPQMNDNNELSINFDEDIPF